MIKDTKGQIMIESIIAITVGVVALTGVLSLLTSSIGINKDVGQRATATYLAMEGIEVTKSLIDANYAAGNPWNQGINTGSYEFVYDTTDPQSASIGQEMSSSYLYFDSSNGLYSYDTSGTQTRFIRTVQIDSLRNGEEVRVKSIVEWTEGTNDRQITVEDHFFNWRPTQG